MPLEVRAIYEDELPTMLEVDRRGFGGVPRAPERADTWVRAHLDRTRCAYDGKALVGCSRAYPFELTVPGGACVPVAAVSSVAVQPTHRRQGVLTAMMSALHDDARARGEVASVLTASESIIYKRFGYGAATWKLGCSITRQHARLAKPVDDPGRVRMVARGEADVLYREIYEDARRARAGMVSRPDYWWPEVYWMNEPGHAYFEAVHEDAGGNLDGFVSYEVKGEWSGGFADRQLIVWDLQASDALARLALWEYVFGIDLIVKFTLANLPVDEPLRFQLADPRQLRTDWLIDLLWVLPLDAAALLAARTYASPGRLAIEVVDPDGTRTQLVLDGGPEGATCVEKREAAPDVSLSRSALGALSLGGNTWAVLNEAREVDEQTPGAIARADAMFATAPAPATLSWF